MRLSLLKCKNKMLMTTQYFQYILKYLVILLQMEVFQWYNMIYTPSHLMIRISLINLLESYLSLHIIISINFQLFKTCLHCQLYRVYCPVCFKTYKPYLWHSINILDKKIDMLSKNANHDTYLWLCVTRITIYIYIF